MSAPSADIICGRRFNCRTSQGLTVNWVVIQAVITRDMHHFVQVFEVFGPFGVKIESCPGDV